MILEVSCKLLLCLIECLVADGCNKFGLSYSICVVVGVIILLIIKVQRSDQTI